MPMPVPQHLEGFAGASAVLEFRIPGIDPLDPADGWTGLRFAVGRVGEAALVAKTVGSGVTVTDSGVTSGTAVIRVQVSAADTGTTLGEGDWRWELQPLGAALGLDDVVAWGGWTLRPKVE